MLLPRWQIISSVTKQQLYFSIFFAVVLVKQIQTTLQLSHTTSQVMIFAFKRLILMHHASQLFLQFLESSQPIFIDHWPVHINRHFNLKLNRNFHLLFNFYRTIDVDWFVNIAWFFYDNRLMIDRLVHVYMLLYYLWHFNFLYDNFRNLFLDFDVLRHFNDLFDYPFGPWDILWHFYFDLHWSFYNNFLYCFFWCLTCIFSQCFILYFQPILFSLQATYCFLMILTCKVTFSQVSQFQSHSYSFSFAFCQLCCQRMYLFEQFLQTFLIAITFKNDLNLFVATT